MISCTSHPWWRSPLVVIFHGLYEISILMQTHGRIPNPTKILPTHIYNGLVHKAIWTNPYRTTRSHDPTWYIVYLYVLNNIESILCTLTWSTMYLLLFLLNDDVLKVNMNVHTISFFKTYLQYARHGIQPWIQHMEFRWCQWTNLQEYLNANISP